MLLWRTTNFTKLHVHIVHIYIVAFVSGIWFMPFVCFVSFEIKAKLIEHINALVRMFVCIESVFLYVFVHWDLFESANKRTHTAAAARRHSQAFALSQYSILINYVSIEAILFGQRLLTSTILFVWLCFLRLNAQCALHGNRISYCDHMFFWFSPKVCRWRSQQHTI